MNCKKCNSPLPEGTLICHCGFLNQPEVFSVKGISSIGKPPKIPTKMTLKVPISILSYIILSFGISQLIVKTGYFSAFFGLKFQTLNIFVIGGSLLLSIISIFITSILMKKFDGLVALYMGVVFSTLGLLIISFSPTLVIIILSELLVFLGCTFLAIIGLRNNSNNVLIPLISIVIGMGFAYLTNLLVDNFKFSDIYIMSSMFVGALSVVLVIFYSISDKTIQIEKLNKGFIYYCCSIALLWIIFFFLNFIFGLVR